jgi:hypothetical protein
MGLSWWVGTATGAALAWTWRLTPHARHKDPRRSRWWAAILGGAIGLGAAMSLRDPFLVPLGASLGAGAQDLLRRWAAERYVLWGTREVLPVLERMAVEVEVGTHPLAAFARACAGLPPRHPARQALESVEAALGDGMSLAEASARWARRERLPALRLLAHLVGGWSVWGIGLSQGLSRVVREADRSVAFGREQQLQYAMYQWITAAFLAVELATLAYAWIRWPKGVPSPVHTPWGHLLLVGSILLTAAAVALPTALASGQPPAPPWWLGRHRSSQGEVPDPVVRP